MIRTATSPPKFLTQPVNVMTIPQLTMRIPKYVDGRLNLFSIMLLGTSVNRSVTRSPLSIPIVLTEKNVWNEEKTERDIILNPSQAQVFVHACYLGISNIRPIQVGYEVQRCKHGHESYIDLQKILC
jgi:hypothetical protein